MNNVSSVLKVICSSGLKCLLPVAIAAGFAIPFVMKSLQLSLPKRPPTWWAYLADYEGLPGSIVVDLSLRSQSPDPAYPFLLITGVSFEADPEKNGLPTLAELDRIYDIEADRQILIPKITPAREVGTFLHKGEELHYFYVTSALGLKEKLEDYYQRKCPGRVPYVKVKPDKDWAAYRDFLFPNQKTIDFYRGNLKQLNLLRFCQY